MARIPVYEERIQASQGFQPGRISAPDANLDAVPRALERLGGAVFDHGVEIAKAETGKVMSDAALYWEQRLPQAKNQAQPGAKDFIPSITSEFDTWSEQTLGSIQDRAVRNMAAKQMSKIREGVVGDAIRFQTDQGRAYRYDLASKANEATAQAINLNPTKFDDYTAARIEAIDAMNMEPDKKQRLKNDLLQQNADAALRSIIQADPVGFLDQINTTNPNTPFVDFDKLYPVIVTHESSGDKLAVSNKGAYGLMQVQIPTAKSPGYNTPNIFDFAKELNIPFANKSDAEVQRLLFIPELNEALGSAYIKNLTEHFDGNLVYGLAAYNWGPGATNKWIADGADPAKLPAETRTYIKKITRDIGHAGFNDKDGTFTGNKFLDMMPVDKRDTYLRMAQSNANSQLSVYKADIDRRVKNADAMAKQGIVDPNPLTLQDMQRVYGPGVGDAKYQEYAKTQTMAGDIASMVQIPLPGMAAMVEKYRPDPAGDFVAESARFQIMNEAYKSVLEMRENDPAGYMQRHNTMVNRAYADYVDTLANPDQTLNPAQQAKISQDARENYANIVLQEQKRFGVVNQGVLSNMDLDRLRAEYLMTPQGEPTAENILLLSELWGDSWQVVYNQLIKNGVLPSMAILVGANPNMPRTIAADMVDASRMPTDEWMKLSFRHTKKELEERLSDHLEPFRKTMVGSDGQSRMHGGVETYTALYEPMLQVAAMYLAKGDKLDTAIRKAADYSIMGNYQFLETYRVPMTYDANIIDYAARNIIYDLDPENLRPARSYGLGVYATQREQARSIKSNAYWITNQTETGVMLYNPEERSVVLDIEGKPIAYTWGQLKVIGDELMQTSYTGMQVAP